MQRPQHLLTSLGWGLLYALLGVAALLTLWSLLALLGIVPTTPPRGQHLTTADVASIGVASATLLLATVTVLLALFTRRSLELGRAELTLAEATLKTAEEQAKRSAEQVTATLEQVAASHAQATVARETLEASFQPFLVDVPFGYAERAVFRMMTTSRVDAASVDFFKRENGTAKVEVPFRNIGSGPAIITKAMLSIGQLHTPASAFSSSIVAVGEVVRVIFDVAPDGAVLINLISQLEAQEAFTVTVWYGDQRGIGKWRSRAQVHWPAGASRYEVLNVELYIGEELVPFATSGPV